MLLEAIDHHCMTMINRSMLDHMDHFTRLEFRMHPHCGSP